MSTPYGGNDPQQWGQYPGQMPQGGQPPPGGEPYPGAPQQPYPGAEQPYPGAEQQWQQPMQQWQQPQQPGYSPYGQYPPSYQPGPQKKSKVWLWVTLAIVLIGAAVVVVLGFFVGPKFFYGTPTFDSTALEEGVVQILGGDQQIDNVQCPDGEPAEQDHTFTCSATVNGEQVQIPITVTDAEADPPIYRVDGPR